MPAIETRALKKNYATIKKQPGVLGALRGLIAPERVEVEAVKGIDLEIEQGELVGFLGPNGAGKTTTLKMLSGILYPTSGEAKVLGFAPHERRPEMLKHLSLVMGNKMQLWWDLPARDGFTVLRDLYEVDASVFKRRTDELIEALQLSDKVDTQIRKLSLGERMKCELVAALLHAPKIVFLDEPTIGLDVVSQKRIRDFLKELHARDNCTIILTSHYMQDVQELCKRVIIIDHGVKVFEGTLSSLTERFADTRRIRLSFNQTVATEDIERYGRVIGDVSETAVIETPRSDVARVMSAVLQELPVVDVAIEDVDIEDVIRDLFTASR